MVEIDHCSAPNSFIKSLTSDLSSGLILFDADLAFLSYLFSVCFLTSNV